MQELKKIRRLVEGRVDLWLSNEVKVVALALGTSYVLVVGTSYVLVVGTSYFVLLNGLILELYNFYFVPIF